ncbi:Na/Pi symporter [Bacillus sp. Hm123]|uniref:Na/Pi symporter n=1 Tax=Bacillus sp. Hm123 TaxID=3450745 RepID=UPI003F43867C
MLQLLLFYEEIYHFLIFFIFIGLFIYGMAILRSGLFNLAEESLKKRLVTLLDCPWKGFITGILMTAVLQSSSAVMIMIIGLISARLLTFPQSIGIILGTNIGKNITNEIITINIDFLIIPLAVIGGILVFIKKENVYNTGRILLGLAAIFAAMWGFEYSAGIWKNMDIIKQLLLAIDKSHVYALLAGMITTGTIQSSSATIGIIMGFLSAGAMKLDTGIAMMLGAMMGTCANVLFTGFVSGGKEEKLAAYAYTWVNVVGVAAFYPLIGFLTTIVQQISAHPDVQLAHAGVILHIVTSTIFLLFANQFGRLILKIHGGSNNRA